MSLGGSKSRLTSITNELAVQWKDAASHWQDAKSREFERDYLKELFVGVDRVTTVIEKLDELLKKVRKDCE